MQRTSGRERTAVGLLTLLGIGLAGAVLFDVYTDWLVQGTTLRSTRRCGRTRPEGRLGQGRPDRRGRLLRRGRRAGLPPGDPEALFDHGYTTDAGGTGFGLTIVAEIARAHGWSVDVAESERGGARFAITGGDRVEGGNRVEGGDDVQRTD